MKLTVVLALLIGTLILACSSADPVPTPLTTGTAIPEPTSLPTATALPEPTAVATSTPVPQPTLTPTPNALMLEVRAAAKLREEERRLEEEAEVRAAARLREAERRLEKEASDWLDQGVSSYRSGLYEDAITNFDKAIEITEKAHFYGWRGNSYKNLGQHEDAIQDYTIAIQFKPTATRYHNRGVSYANLGQRQNAVNDYTNAIQLDPDYAVAYNNRGFSYDNLGQYEKARIDEVKACSLDSKHCASPTIEIINYSSYRTSDIEEWVTLAEAKMKDRRASVIFNIYPVGHQISEGAFLEGHPGAQHKVILEPSQIEAVLGSMDSWLGTRSCISEERRGRKLAEWRIWLEQGVKMGNQTSLCSDTRVVFMAISDDMRNDPSDLTEFQRFLFHESYHGFQQDLLYGGVCRERSKFNNANSNWMIEGGAEYFARFLLDEINGTSNAMNVLLGNALSEYDESGAALTISGEPWLSVWKGPAPLRLMVEKGMLDEASIMDGSLFHDCAREMVFDSASPEICLLYTSPSPRD